jgi:hypothetical protein
VKDITPTEFFFRRTSTMKEREVSDGKGQNGGGPCDGIFVKEAMI